MPFIGQQPTTGTFVELDSLTASATANYTLQLNGANYYPESVNNLLVSINGVIQGSSTMSLNGAVLTVGATLSASDVIDFVRVFGNVGTISTPTDGSVTANKIGTGAVTSAKIADGTIVNADINASAGIAGSKLGTGAVLQVKNFQTGTFAEGNTAIPFDNTIPQITEGTEFMTLAITPTATTSKLLIQVVLNGSGTTTGDMITALFVGTTADALASAVDYDVSRGQMVINYHMTANTTSELTFRVRAGRSSAEDFYFNGYHNSNPLFGGTLMSSITITEIGA